MSTTKATRTSLALWVDLEQGENGQGHSFGYVGKGTDQRFCGMFFEWPEGRSLSDRVTRDEVAVPQKITRQEAEQMVASLALDETERHSKPHISRAAAERALRHEIAVHNHKAY